MSNTLGRRLRLGMVGGGPGAFIGAVHRIASRIDDKYELVAASLSSSAEKTRAAAAGSARILNSPTGVMLPDTVIAPPMTTTLFARRNVCGEREAARAKLVRGPIAIMSMVSLGLSSRISKIAKCEGFDDGVKSWVGDAGSTSDTLVALDVRRLSVGGRSNSVSQVFSGLVWCGCFVMIVSCGVNRFKGSKVGTNSSVDPTQTINAVFDRCHQRGLALRH